MPEIKIKVIEIKDEKNLPKRLKTKKIQSKMNQNADFSQWLHWILEK